MPVSTYKPAQGRTDEIVTATAHRQRSVASPQPRRISSRRRAVSRWSFRVVLAAILLWSLGPFYWLINASFQTDRQLSEAVPTFLPFPGGTFNNYIAVFTERDFLPYIGNSVLIAGSATVLGTIIAAAAAYSLARLKLPAKGAILAVIVAISMFPQIAIVTPLYQFYNKIGWLDSYHGLSTAYVGLMVPLMVFIMYSHFRALPKELDEAAKIDGAGPVRTLVSITIPLVLPGVVTAGLIGFILNWQELLLALSFQSSPDVQTVPIGIAKFTSYFLLPWGDMSAAAVSVTIPVVILILVFQKRIIAGVTSGAIKE